jgi:hypothetical protein
MSSIYSNVIRARLAAEKAALGAEYKSRIGYDPFEDDPTTTIDEVRQTLAEHAAIEAEESR